MAERLVQVRIQYQSNADVLARGLQAGVTQANLLAQAMKGIANEQAKMLATATARRIDATALLNTLRSPAGAAAHVGIIQQNRMAGIAEAQVKRQQLALERTSFGTPEHTKLIREQLQLQKDEARNQRLQTFYERREQFGTPTAALMGLEESIGGFTRKLEVAGLAASATLTGLAAAASPVLFQTLTGSFQLLAGELGIILIPTILEVSATAQSAARWLRGLDQGAQGAVNSVVQWTLVLGVGAFAFNRVIGTLRNVGVAFSAVRGVVSQLGMGGSLVLGTFAALAAAGIALATSWQREAERLENRAQVVQASGAEFQDIGELSTSLQQQLRGASSDAERVEIARSAVAEMQQERPGLQERAEDTSSTAQELRESWLGMAVDIFSGGMAARGLENIGVPLPSWATPTGLINTVATGSQNLPVAQNTHAIATLNSLIERGGGLPRPGGNADDPMRRNLAIALAGGDFQSRQTGFDSLHNLVQQEAIRAPLEEERFQQQMAAMQEILRYMDQGQQNQNTILGWIRDMARPPGVP